MRSADASWNAAGRGGAGLVVSVDAVGVAVEAGVEASVATDGELADGLGSRAVALSSVGSSEPEHAVRPATTTRTDVASRTDREGAATGLTPATLRTRADDVNGDRRAASSWARNCVDTFARAQQTHGR